MTLGAKMDKSIESSNDSAPAGDAPANGASVDTDRKAPLRSTALDEILTSGRRPEIKGFQFSI
jgi:hypothetical protein